MTDISEQDEREAREWLKRRANGDEPAEPVKIEAWGIAAPNGEIIHVRKTADAARQRAQHCPDDVRIVHLVEADRDPR